MYVNHYNEASLENVKIVHENNITYIGNNTNLIFPYWSQITGQHFFKGILVPQNRSTHDLLNYDFIKVISNDYQPNLYLVMWNGIDEEHIEMPFYQEDDTTWILPLSAWSKSQILSFPNNQSFIYWKGELNESVISWSFQVQLININKVVQGLIDIYPELATIDFQGNFLNKYSIYITFIISIILLSVAILILSPWISVTLNRKS